VPGAERIVRRAPQPDAGGAEADAWPLWLGEQPAKPAQVKALLAPYPSDGMVCWPVSPRVGSVKNNDPSLIEPVTAEL
jgi:putative SOS response-associated peptidase YedK